MEKSALSEREPAVERAAQLLIAIARDRGRNTIAAHAAALGIPLSTAYRIVDVLTRSGLLAPGRRGHFGPGLVLGEIGGAASPRAILADMARPLVRRLARTVRATAHLGILDGDMVTYIVKEHAGGPHLFTREDEQLEAYCSAIGKILLAHLPPDQVDRYLASAPFVPLTARTTTDPDAIRGVLDDIRRADHATDDREVADDLFCVAVPIRDRSGAVIAAVSVSRQIGNVREPSILPDLLACAAAIGNRLGA